MRNVARSGNVTCMHRNAGANDGGGEWEVKMRLVEVGFHYVYAINLAPISLISYARCFISTKRIRDSEAQRLRQPLRSEISLSIGMHPGFHCRFHLELTLSSFFNLFFFLKGGGNLSSSILYIFVHIPNRSIVSFVRLVY